MGFVDCLAAEDRVQVTASTYYKLMMEAATSELLQNAVKCDVPHRYIREMITGEKEEVILPEITETVEAPEEEKTESGGSQEKERPLKKSAR